MKNDEVIDLQVATTQQNVAVARAQDNAMGVNEIIAQVRLIQEVMTKVMSEGEHFGVIPGCGTRKTLLQPGAQKLCMTFRLAPEYQIQETNFDRGHKEYRVTCTLKSISSGAFVGQGVGCCSTLESKYRWRGGARKCPECGKETIIKGKAEYGGGWLCFGKKGGCGQKWPDGAAEIEGQSVDKVETDSPADAYNTVLKMAKKRAFVDATITATAASDIFTQDIADPEGDDTTPEPPKRPVEKPAPAALRTPAPAAKPSAAPKQATPSPTGTKQGSEADWAVFLEACKSRLLALITPDDEWAWWKYGCDQSWILPMGEHLGDAVAAKIFEGLDRANFKESAKAIATRHTSAVHAMAANCPPEFREEVMRGFIRMPLKDAEPEKPAKKTEAAPRTRTTAKPGQPNSCRICNSTATKKHDDLVGVSWCQSCGNQWQDGAPDESYEEHEWMFAQLPFAPKDANKKKYKGMGLGQIARLDPKYFFGIVMNFEAKPFNGRPPSEESVKFGVACELAKKHIQAANAHDTGDKDGPPDDDDIPL